MASEVRPHDLPPFPVLADDLDRHHVVAGLWLWMTEIRFRYPKRDAGQCVLDMLGAEHEKFGQRMVLNPLYDETKQHHHHQAPTSWTIHERPDSSSSLVVPRVSIATVANALRQTHIVICRSLARTLRLSHWWCTAMVTSTLTPPPVSADDAQQNAWARAHHNARKELERTMLRDSRARTDLVPDAYLPIDVFRDSLPLIHVLL